jgi:sulfatase modifying factor 1
MNQKIKIVSVLTFVFCCNSPEIESLHMPEKSEHNEFICESLAKNICQPYTVGSLYTHSSVLSDAITEDEALEKRANNEHNFLYGIYLQNQITCQFSCLTEKQNNETTSCLQDSDCPNGLSCQNKQCTFWNPCKADDDCAENHLCEGGICVEICGEFVNCKTSPYDHPRWCEAQVARARVHDGQCMTDQKACDFTGTEIAVDCSTRGQICHLDRCMDLALPAPDINNGLTYIPASTFLMGSTRPDAPPHELPHQVTLTHPLWVHTGEVTQGQWFARMRTFPTVQFACGADCPISAVSWWDALAYANQLSNDQGLAPCFDLQGCNDLPYGQGFACQSMTILATDSDPYQCEGYRLPTEAEWEFFARANTDTDTWAGDITADSTCDQPSNILHNISWFAHNSLANHAGCSPDPSCGPQACLGLQTIRTRQANPWGLFDTLGNVAEWTLDSFNDNLQDTTNPWHNDLALPIVTRGGAWDSAPQALRVSTRTPAAPTHTAPNLGFRLVRTARPLHTCQQDADCHQDTLCDQGRCAPSHCRNGSFDTQQETSLDCGLDCPPCPAGAACISDADCQDRHHCDRLYCTPDRSSLIPPGVINIASETPRTLQQNNPYWMERNEAYFNPQNIFDIDARNIYPHGTPRQAFSAINNHSRLQKIQECYINKNTKKPHTPENEKEDIIKIEKIPCLGFSMPDNDQWEYAARSGSPYEGLLRPVTNQTIDASLFTWNPYNATVGHQPTQQKLPNFFNLYDMQGNISEWISTPGVSPETHETKGGSHYLTSSPFERMEFSHIRTQKSDEFFAVGIRLTRRLPPVIECGTGCAEQGCQESPHRTWIRGDVEALGAGPGGLAMLRLRGEPQAALATTAADLAPLPLAPRRWSTHQGQHLLLNDDGRLWRLEACDQTTPAATQVSENIQDFQQTTDALYLLDREGRLWRQRDGDPAPLASDLRDFVVTADTLWTLDRDGALWRQPLDLASPPLRHQDGITALEPDGDDAFYLLGQRGCLWRMDPTRKQAVDANVTAMAAAQGRLYTLHHDGHLWLQHATQGHCPPEGCPAPERDAAMDCLLRSALSNP